MTQSSPKIGEAGDLIERLARIMRSGEHGAGLNPAQWEALRYISKCNRFSNSPAALTDYVSATRGTVSQTLNALERKGLIKKEMRPDDKRSVTLSLTARGEKTLLWDPWQRIGLYEGALEEDAVDGLVSALQSLLRDEFSRSDLKSFGDCRSCRHFQENAYSRAQAGPHRCGYFKAPLKDEETSSICAGHAGRRAA